MSNDNDPIEVGTIITAIRSCTNGSRRQHDLIFEDGDIMKVIKVCDSQWVLASLKDKQGYVPLNHVKSINWFHGKITREQAEYLLQDKVEGSYLVRESTHFRGDYTLCLKSEQKIENYRIRRELSSYAIDDEACFSNLIKLIEHYSKIQELASLLRIPIRVEKRVPEIDDLQTLISNDKFNIIDKSQIQKGKEIGTGEFGAVYKGKYNNIDVAIKIIKDVTEIKEFFKEAHVMSTLNHPNLLKLFGIVIINEERERKEIYLVTEYMPKGSLLDYLITRGRNVLTRKELIKFSVHICEGMSYLEEKGIVHRDLAASNVLISEDNVAKVSDFGLAKKIMDETVTGRIRVRWTAPEAVKEKHYSNKSDMWSYGVLLWEIFSYGRTPFPKIPASELIHYIERGNQMEKPEGCPDEIYNLMKQAWKLEPTIRPSFKDALIQLKDIQTKYKNDQ